MYMWDNLGYYVQTGMNKINIILNVCTLLIEKHTNYVKGKIIVWLSFDLNH